MKKVIDIQIGHVAVATGKTVLKSSALGSCIAITVWDAAGGVVAQAVGGIKRRGIVFDLESKIVSHTQSDSGEKQLWQWL